MASSRKIVEAIIQLLTKTSDEIPGPATIPSAPKGKLGPGPDPIDSLTINEGVGIAEPRRNQFQETLIEESAAKRFRNPLAPDFESQRKSVFDESPDRFGPGQLEQEIMEEVTGPRSRVHRQTRVSGGSTDDAASVEQLDDLFGEETTRQAQRIQDILDDPSTPQLTPTLEREVAGGLASNTIQLKRVDEISKRVFERIAELEEALTLPETSSQASRGELFNSRKRLQQFKKEAAQAAQKAREANDPEIIRAIEDRLTGPLKGSQGTLNLGASENIAPTATPKSMEDIGFTRTSPELSFQRKTGAQQGKTFKPKSSPDIELDQTLVFPETEFTSEQTLLNTLRDILNARRTP